MSRSEFFDWSKSSNFDKETCIVVVFLIMNYFEKLKDTQSAIRDRLLGLSWWKGFPTISTGHLLINTSSVMSRPQSKVTMLSFKISIYYTILIHLGMHNKTFITHNHMSSVWDIVRHNCGCIISVWLQSVSVHQVLVCWKQYTMVLYVCVCTVCVCIYACFSAIVFIYTM